MVRYSRYARKALILRKNKLSYLRQRKLIATLPAGPRRTAFERETDGMRVWIDLLLPEDFMAGVVTYALGITKSDIKEVTENALYSAAVLAKIGNDNPADHLHGIFTDYMRDDINLRAAIILKEREKEQKHGN